MFQPCRMLASSPQALGGGTERQLWSFLLQGTGCRGGQGALLAPGDKGNAGPISDRLKSPPGELGGPTAKSPGEKSSPISSTEPQLLAAVA